MSKIVSERYRFGQILVESERTRDASGYLSYLKRVSHSRAVVVTRGRKEDLSLIHKAAEGLTVSYLISVALKFGSQITRHHGSFPAAGICRMKCVNRQITCLILKAKLYDAFSFHCVLLSLRHRKFR
jgi:hypothetical protein